ncbi:hypothetical protein LEN26_010751 [Aphanomyces euteiches]|nr:hypothetical protein AeMF1_015803 [Aphanomyces euteiches]KAH9121271.1 hypothetical protein LEN26_010751 [Aphanomyces euteiches]KAH9192219.1 hypothetical protein AeNC1_005796 [Aphanomyces euteiches]
MEEAAAGRELQRRDSIAERIEQSIAEHIQEDTYEAVPDVTEDEEQPAERASLLRETSSALKEELQDKLQRVKASHQVFLVISSLYKHRYVSSEARNVLKNQAIDEVRSPDGILSAAVELLLVDWDVDECIDTFVKVSQMLLAAA